MLVTCMPSQSNDVFFLPNDLVILSFPLCCPFASQIARFHSIPFNPRHSTPSLLGRPARTWFQSEDMKQSLKELSKTEKTKHMEAQALQMEEQKNKRVHRLSRAKRRRIEMKADMERDRQEAEAEGDRKMAARSNLDALDAKQSVKARHTKKLHQPQGIERESGNKPEQDKKKKKKKPQKTEASSDGGGLGLGLGLALGL
jgi:hypothetical protein